MSSNADAMALVYRRATFKPTGTSTKSSADSSSVPPTTALFARPNQTSGAPTSLKSSQQPMPASTAAAAAPTKIDTSAFGRDNDIDSYRSQMLDLVYHRSLHRAGLE
eukprot:CAMPEP_0197727812 /NCGR_PEP_ID=MMETSP1434-20131217/23085_1 /TAXON_ID=265543 /ORGANISM="Minutocellus polymorphus, Strain CCMP3303" /LENGTH=106 /DNA_ID=CAMNT_0043314105 /DNA_START=175 /DNA_END=495 /DNA_ORIENTATION=-